MVLYTCGLFYLCKWSWSYLCYVDDKMLLQIRLMLLVGRSQILLVVSLSLLELCEQTLAVLFMLMLFHCVVVINGHGSVLLVRFNNMVCYRCLLCCFSGVYAITDNDILLVSIDVVRFLIWPKHNSCDFFHSGR